MLENLKPHADYQSERGILFNQDCLEIFKLIEENSIDLITTDPPYPTTARGSAGNSGGMLQKEINKMIIIFKSFFNKRFKHNLIISYFLKLK